MIPKIIHCCWYGGPKTPLARRCLASWLFYAPDWEIREWDLETVRAKRAEKKDELLGCDGFEFFEAAIAAKKWAMASDWLRMFALYLEGGVYFDFDVELLASLDRLPEGEWVAGEKTAAGEVWPEAGAGIALEKGSAVARMMLDAYHSIKFDPNREMMPWINSHLSKMPVRMLDPELMCPIDVDGRSCQSERTIAVHRYAMSWASPKLKIIRWLNWHGMRPIVQAALCLRNSLLRFLPFRG